MSLDGHAREPAGEGAREAIVASGVLESKSVELGLDKVRRWSRRPDAAFWYALPYAEGIKTWRS